VRRYEGGGLMRERLVGRDDEVRPLHQTLEEHALPPVDLAVTWRERKETTRRIQYP